MEQCRNLKGCFRHVQYLVDENGVYNPNLNPQKGQPRLDDIAYHDPLHLKKAEAAREIDLNM